MVLLYTILLDYCSSQIGERWLIETRLCLTSLCIHTNRPFLMVLHMHRLFNVGLHVVGYLFFGDSIGFKSHLLAQPAVRSGYVVLGPDAVQGEDCPDFTKGANRDGNSIAFLRNRGQSRSNLWSVLRWRWLCKPLENPLFVEASRGAAVSLA